jgi:hypothetical protein
VQFGGDVLTVAAESGELLRLGQLAGEIVAVEGKSPCREGECSGKGETGEEIG